ncbi:MAG: rhodanese-like domain-containing protein [Bacteroidia bacterium]|nr:rhodanese-like domain-containing protein [Bacteroidia bacterium]MBT8229098.1 rhodanese-like domain-containing protein [Bacteroidia bacterium]
MEFCEVPRWLQIKQQLKNLSYDDFKANYQDDPLGVCLDVRRPDEFEPQHIKGATNVNYLSKNLIDELEELPKGKHYYIYCRTGRRSLRVAILMQNMGYKVYNLDGGLVNAE